MTTARLILLTEADRQALRAAITMLRFAPRLHDILDRPGLPADALPVSTEGPWCPEHVVPVVCCGCAR